MCNEVSKGIASVSLQSKIPVMFGVLTTDNIEQAIERAGSKAGNKGYECAVGAIEMVNLMRVMESKDIPIRLILKEHFQCPSFDCNTLFVNFQGKIVRVIKECHFFACVNIESDRLSYDTPFIQFSYGIID